MIVISAEVRDPAIVHDLEGLRPDGFHRGTSVPIVTARRAGEGRVTAVVTETRTASAHDVELSADVTWADGSGGRMEASFSGLSPTTRRSSVSAPGFLPSRCRRRSTATSRS
jgi:hypothetical protein